MYVICADILRSSNLTENPVSIHFNSEETVELYANTTPYGHPADGDSNGAIDLI